MRFLYFICVSALLGCGGGGGTPNIQTTSNSAIDLTGTVYADAILSNATVNIKCSNGAGAAGSTNNAGQFLISINAPEFPCIIKVSNGYSGSRLNSDNLYSVALQSNNIVVSYITTFGLITNTSNIDAEFQNPNYASYNQSYLSQSIANLDSRLSMANFLTMLSNFNSGSSYEKEIIANFSKSLFYRSRNQTDFANAIANSNQSTNLAISYSPYYGAYNFRVANISDLYWLKAYGVYKNNSLISWMVYPKSTSDYYSSGNPELYNLIVPAINSSEGGNLDLWIEETYPNPSASATLFVNNIPSGSYQFTYTSISRAWYQ